MPGENCARVTVPCLLGEAPPQKPVGTHSTPAGWPAAGPGSPRTRVPSPQSRGLLLGPPAAGGAAAPEAAPAPAQQQPGPLHQLHHQDLSPPELSPSDPKHTAEDTKDLHLWTRALEVTPHPPSRTLESRLENGANTPPTSVPSSLLLGSCALPCPSRQRGPESWVTRHLINVIFNLELSQTAD